MKTKMNSRKNTLIAAGMIVAVLVIGVLLVTTIVEYGKNVVRNQSDQMLTIITAAANSVETYIDDGMRDISSFLETREFSEGEREYLTTGANRSLLFTANTHMRSHYPIVSDIEIYDKYGNYIVNLREREYRLIDRVDKWGVMDVSIFQDQDDKMYLALSKANDNGTKLRFYLDCENMFDTLMSQVELGEKGYIMVKDSEGTIIMHVVRSQIGMNVIEGRKERYPEADLSELEALVKHQLAGETGTRTYHSYWWSDDGQPLKEVKKISAYTPAHIGDGYIVLSAVMDYSEILKPMIEGIAKIASMGALFVLVIAGGLSLIYRALKERTAFAEENQYLKEINQRLEELHKSEEYINHQQRLQMIGTMTGGIAHEFNNFLTPIMGYAGLIMSTDEEGSDNYENAREIYEAAEKAKEIVQQVSSLSKKNIDTVFQYLPLHSTLDRVIKMVESACPKNIEIESDIDIDGGILGNKTQINQVILNISMNAFHAIGQKGGTVSFFAREEEGYAKIRICDNGCGMDEMTREQIFNPFFTTKETGQGVGLGLAMVQNIVEGHHGVIEVESELGKGTCFVLYFPMAKQEKKEHEMGGYRVLLVSDNLKILKLLEKGLEQEKIENVTAANIDTAKELIEKTHFDVAVVDADMGKKNGVDLACQLKFRQNDLRIIMMAGLVRKEIRDAKEHGVIDSILQKPVVFTELLEELDR